MMVVIILSAVLMLTFQCAVSDVVDDFSECSDFFFENQPPEIPGVLVEGESQNQNRYKTICQRFNNVYTFATLYDTKSRIPVFSAYRYSGKGNFNRKKDLQQTWTTEPQLQDDEQAADADYSTDPLKVDRGHLFPCSHAKDLPTAESTFTLTNAVPQIKSFNSGSWKLMEDKTKQLMDSHCLNKNKVAYVLTGAVPDTSTEKKTLNNRVNIPSMMWTAFCCCDSESCFSKAHWAKNEDDVNQRTIPTVSLMKLQDELKNTWLNGVKGLKLFKENCLLDESKITNLPLPDTECEDQKSKCPLCCIKWKSCDIIRSTLKNLQDKLKKTWINALKLFNDKCLTDEPVNADLPLPVSDCEEQKSSCHQSLPVTSCETSCDIIRSTLNLCSQK